MPDKKTVEWLNKVAPKLKKLQEPRFPEDVPRAIRDEYEQIRDRFETHRAWLCGLVYRQMSMCAGSLQSLMVRLSSDVDPPWMQHHVSAGKVPAWEATLMRIGQWGGTTKQLICDQCKAALDRHVTATKRKIGKDEAELRAMTKERDQAKDPRARDFYSHYIRGKQEDLDALKALRLLTRKIKK